MLKNQVYSMCVYVIISLLVVGVMRPASSSLESVNCTNVKNSFAQKGFATDVPKSSGYVRLCGSGPCCTEGMEQQLGYYSRRQFLQSHNHTLAQLGAVLKSRAIRFDDVFKEMLSKSKRDFHDMFIKTYGIIYEQNSYVFTDLFMELERYYAKGTVDLTDVMDEFFTTLYQKMFTVLNAQYRFDDKFLECVNERMKVLMPFGDVPSKLSTLLKRSFVATRTFSQALHIAADIVNSMRNVSITDSCFSGVAKMSHCQACSGLSELKPCTNYCANVMKGCLAYHYQLDNIWNDFINSTDLIIDRLLGPFNIEMVVEPIDIKISEAIMNFQENAQQVSEKVFTKCGKPGLGRAKRDRGEIELETLDFSNRGGVGENTNGRGDEMGKLESVIRETRKTLRSTKNFWKQLPYKLCGEDVVAGVNNECWNGTAKDKYGKDVVGDGFTRQQVNPEVSVDIVKPNSLINEHIFSLKTINNRLRNAYNGMDLEWIDNEEFYGSGSGGGSGAGIVDTVEAGSGTSPTETSEASFPVFPDPTPSHEEDSNVDRNEIPLIPDLRKVVNDTSTKDNNISSAPQQNLSTFVFLVILVFSLIVNYKHL